MLRNHLPVFHEIAASPQLRREQDLLLQSEYVSADLMWKRPVSAVFRIEQVDFEN